MPWPVACIKVEFQHTAARRRLDIRAGSTISFLCFNTQPPEGGWNGTFSVVCTYKRFNTQPPEGGWQDGTTGGSGSSGFNTQPPEGGWNLKIMAL